MGWILFMQKRGLFQQLVPMTGSFSEGFFSFGGLVQVMSLHVFPFLMTILKNAILNITASLEESGAVFGASFGLRLQQEGYGTFCCIPVHCTDRERIVLERQNFFQRVIPYHSAKHPKQAERINL